MPLNDTPQLEAFVTAVQEDLEVVVTNFEQLAPSPGSIQINLLTQGWNNVKPRFQEVTEYLQGKRQLDKLDDELQDRGLTGDQLALKLSLFRARRAEFTNEWTDFQKATTETKARRRGFIGGIIRRLLSVINRILDSLGFVPGAEAIKEFKGVLEEAIS